MFCICGSSVWMKGLDEKECKFIVYTQILVLLSYLMQNVEPRRQGIQVSLLKTKVRDNLPKCMTLNLYCTKKAYSSMYPCSKYDKYVSPRVVHKILPRTSYFIHQGHLYILASRLLKHLWPKVLILCTMVHWTLMRFVHTKSFRVTYKR